jgi:phospholipid transport system substrate-binding protein
MTYLVCMFCWIVMGGAVSCPAAVEGATENSVAGEARVMIDRMGQETISVLIQPGGDLAARQNLVRHALGTYFDLPAIARFSMGHFWKTMTPEQKSRLQKLFEVMIVNLYAERFRLSGDAKGSGDTAMTVSFHVTGAIQEGRGVRVSSQVLMPDRSPLQVDWKVFKTSRGLRVLDVFVEGMSMSMTQRSDFAARLQKRGGSVDAFLDDLESDRPGSTAP